MVHILIDKWVAVRKETERIKQEGEEMIRKTRDALDLARMQAFHDVMFEGEQISPEDVNVLVESAVMKHKLHDIASLAHIHNKIIAPLKKGEPVVKKNDFGQHYH